MSNAISSELSKKDRRRARVLAFQVIYSYEQGVNKGLHSVFEAVSSMDEAKLASIEATKLARVLAAVTLDKMEYLDELLQKHMANWELSRVSAIDRNILRVSLAELVGDFETPLRVVINEAVEIAKLYGADDSAKFINGVLDAVKCDIDYIE